MSLKPALNLVCMMLVLVCAGSPQASTSTAPRHIEITAHRFSYEPEGITLRKDEPVLLVLKSTDVTHGLRIRELGLDLKATKDRPNEMLFTPRKAGDFTGQCSVFCGARHGSMKLIFHVVE